MQLNQQGQISNTRNLINQNFLPDYENSTSTKTFKQLQSNKSPPTSPRTTSPLSQMMEIKTIKNDQFLFRMKLKFIACMQQLEVTKEDIETLRKQQSDSDILSSFITPIKKEFAGLKKLKDEYLLKQGKNPLSMKSTKNIESLQIISLQSQIQEISESQKKLKHRCQRLFTENTELVQKLKKKQHEFEQSENSLYQTKLLLKEYESVIENLKISAKRVEKDFLNQKQRLNEEVNAFKELMIRQREAKQIYLSKLDHVQTILLEKENLVKRISDEVDSLKKECIKWKNRSEWKDNENSQEIKFNDQKLKSFEQEIQKLNDVIKTKDSQLSITKKQVLGSTEVFNKKLQKIVEEWKAKLIDTIEEYEATIESYSAKLSQMEKQNQRVTERQREVQVLIVQKGELSQQLSLARASQNESNHKIINLQTQLKQASNFYTQKVRQLQSIITQLKSQNLSKSISIDQSKGSLSQLEFHIKDKIAQTQKLRIQLLNKQNELRKILQAKKDTQNQLLKRISSTQNNRIIEISRMKVQYQQKFNTLENELKRLKSQLQKYDKQSITVSLKKQVHFSIASNQHVQVQGLPQQDSHMKSSIPSVNNSFNMPNDRANDRVNDRTNRLITQTYIQPQKKSSVRRIFVRSNSISEYLKQKMGGGLTSDQQKQKITNHLSGQTFSFDNNNNITVIKNINQQQKQ